MFFLWNFISLYNKGKLLIKERKTNVLMDWLYPGTDGLKLLSISDIQFQLICEILELIIVVRNLPGSLTMLKVSTEFIECSKCFMKLVSDLEYWFDLIPKLNIYKYLTSPFVFQL